ncbi:protein kinase-like domain [Colletotrichum incanum]|uniref:Protein kinase-like domain n=1 Tax=Colletotrichum incanum TaxID=1573173 RepID=A0A161X116_COLIC|nr:protein kinase-like domain [Colletotrichum incanum]
MDSKRKTQIELSFSGDRSDTSSENPTSSKLRGFTNRTSPIGRNLFKPSNVSQPHIESTSEKHDTSVGNYSDSSRALISKDSTRPLDINWCSPWNRYEASCKLSDLGGELWAATSWVNIRRFPRDIAEQTLRKFRSIKHQNIVAFYEAYMTDDYLHVVLEDMTFSLLHIVKSLRYPNEAQLGTILRQVVDGICFLEEEGWDHPLLDCDNILISERGLVKIANQQLCQPSTGQSSRRHLDALGNVTQVLMQKFCKERPGIDDMDRWPPDSDGFTFLASIESASSIKELQQHPLMRYRDVGCLRTLIRLTQVTVFPRVYSLELPEAENSSPIRDPR